MSLIRGISIKAICWGFLIDTACSLSIAFLIGIVMVMMGMSQNEISIHMHSTIGLIMSLIIGFGFTFLGGYIAGRIAKHYEVLNGGIVGALGLLLFFVAPLSSILWHDIISIVGIIPVGMGGGFFAIGHSKK
jgi:hypothetical protein